MPSPELFGWGAVGAFVSYLVLFVVPEAVKAQRGEQVLQITIPRLVGSIVLLVAFLFIGGVLTVALSDATDVASAITFGLSVESIAGGTLKGFAAP
jgi:hypothetical protein